MQAGRMLKDLLKLCGVPSISETKCELDMAIEIYRLLSEIDYFVSNPQQVQICPIPNDRLKRGFVYALMRSKKESPKTVILLSHFDVVGVEEFGIAKELAFNPDAYTKYLKCNCQIQLNEEARADLKSGDYLFGRGIADMKFGIAADVEVLRQMERRLDEFEGNILFLSVPDEESNSAGMLAAAELLLSLKKEKQLEYSCCLVSEPHFPKYPGDDKKYIYTGTVGKLLPSFYCTGKETHVCEPFSGLNPNRFTSKLIDYIDSNPELSDSVYGIFAPAPACLKQSDVKEAYSVQTPSAAYVYFNFITLKKPPQEVMRCMADIAKSAFEEVLSDIEKKAEILSGMNGHTAKLHKIEPKVITFNELYRWCYETHGEKFESHLKNFIDRNRNEKDLRELSVEIVKEAHQFCPYRDPMIIVFYAPPFYPHSEIKNSDSRIMKLSRYLVEFAKRAYGEDLEIDPFFPGVSDMSYLGLPESINIDELVLNFPAWDSCYSVPLSKIAELNIPFINIGPLGKDAHKYTERLCVSYSFEKAAYLIWEAVRYLLMPV